MGRVYVWSRRSPYAAGCEPCPARDETLAAGQVRTRDYSNGAAPRLQLDARVRDARSYVCDRADVGQEIRVQGVQRRRYGWAELTECCGEHSQPGDRGDRRGGEQVGGDAYE